jgi:hypothetical protein
MVTVEFVLVIASPFGKAPAMEGVYGGTPPEIVQVVE